MSFQRLAEFWKNCHISSLMCFYPHFFFMWHYFSFPHYSSPLLASHVIWNFLFLFPLKAECSPREIRVRSSWLSPFPPAQIRLVQLISPPGSSLGETSMDQPERPWVPQDTIKHLVNLCSGRGSKEFLSEVNKPIPGADPASQSRPQQQVEASAGTAVHTHWPDVTSTCSPGGLHPTLHSRPPDIQKSKNKPPANSRVAWRRL